MNVVQKKREGGPLPSAARAETTIQTNEDEAVFETPTDDAGNLYFDTGCFADELPDSSQHMPEYKYTVTGHRKKWWDPNGPGRQQVGRKCLVNGEEIALFRYGPHVVALSDVCSHAGGSIHLGDIEEVDGHICVSCPRHGFCFDIATGKGVRPTTFEQDVYPIILVTASEPGQADDDSDSGGEREAADTPKIIGVIEVEETCDGDESDQEADSRVSENDEVNGLAIGSRRQQSKPRVGSTGNSSPAVLGSVGSFGSFGSMGSIHIEYDNEEETTFVSHDEQSTTRGEQFSVTGVVRGDEVGSLDGPRGYVAASDSPFRSSQSGSSRGGGGSVPVKPEPLEGPVNTTATRSSASKDGTIDPEESPRSVNGFSESGQRQRIFIGFSGLSESIFDEDF